MGMGIMRVGVEELGITHYHMRFLATITGPQVDFIIRQRGTAATGHLLFITAPIATT